MRLWRSTTNWHFTVDVEDPAWRQGRPLEVIPDVIKVKGDGPPPAGDYFHGPVPLMRAPLVRALSSLPGVQLQTAPARLVGAAGKDAGDDLAPLLVVNIIGCASIAHWIREFLVSSSPFSIWKLLRSTSFPARRCSFSNAAFAVQRLRRGQGAVQGHGPLQPPGPFRRRLWVRAAADFSPVAVGSVSRPIRPGADT